MKEELNVDLKKRLEGMNHFDIIIKQKKIADDILNKLQPIDPHAIVAGGAPRDWYFDKPATDIDVFLYSNLKGDAFKFAEILGVLGISIKEVKTGDNISEEYARNPSLKYVYDTEIDGVKVQLMWMMKPTFNCVLPKFPLGIVKIWYKEKIHTTREFDLAVKYKAIIKYSNVYNNSDKYIQKIKDKFPDYKYYDSLESFVNNALV